MVLEARLIAARGELEGLIKKTQSTIGGITIESVDKLGTAVSPPQEEPISLDEYGFTVLYGIKTDIYKRDGETRPEPHQLIIVNFRTLEDFATAAISDEGYATYDGNQDLTLPPAEDTYYPTLASLRCVYASAYTNALLVTQFVAGSIQRRHNIAIDAATVPGLMHEWQEASRPTPTSPPHMTVNPYIARLPSITPKRLVGIAPNNAPA